MWFSANRHLWIISLPSKVAVPGAEQRRRDRISSDTGRMCSRAVRISKASASKLASLGRVSRAQKILTVSNQKYIRTIQNPVSVEKKVRKETSNIIEAVKHCDTSRFYKKCCLQETNDPGPRNNSPLASRR